MTIHRRSLALGAAFLAFPGWHRLMAAESTGRVASAPGRMLLSDFTGSRPWYKEGAGWRGFTDRVMGGISDAAFGQDTVAGKTCVRMTGNVTRENNGGFIQMAMYFGRNDAELDGSDYSGIELLVHGNDEDYNLHLRTADCGWYDQSYRATFFAKPDWQTVRIPWAEFKPNGVPASLDTARINRIAILGWMREFRADLALAEIALYK